MTAKLFVFFFVNCFASLFYEAFFIVNYGNVAQVSTILVERARTTCFPSSLSISASHVDGRHKRSDSEIHRSNSAGSLSTLQERQTRKTNHEQRQNQSSCQGNENSHAFRSETRTTLKNRSLRKLSFSGNLRRLFDNLRTVRLCVAFLGRKFSSDVLNE